MAIHVGGSTPFYRARSRRLRFDFDLADLMPTRSVDSAMTAYVFAINQWRQLQPEENYPDNVKGGMPRASVLSFSASWPGAGARRCGVRQSRSVCVAVLR